MTNDIHLSKRIGRYEPVVEVVGLPAHSCRDGVAVFEGGVPALVPFPVGNHALDVTVSQGQGWEVGEEGKEGDWFHLDVRWRCK